MLCLKESEVKKDIEHNGINLYSPTVFPNLERVIMQTSKETSVKEIMLPVVNILAIDLLNRVVSAMDDSTDGREINPYTFFNHPELSNWLAEAKELLSNHKIML